MERGVAEAGSGPAGGQDQETGPWRSRLAVVAGSTTALVAASLTGSALGFLNKSACRLGTGTSTSSSSRRIATPTSTPLYFGEGLSRGRCPIPAIRSSTSAHRRGQCSWSPGRCGRSPTPSPGAGSSSTSRCCCWRSSRSPGCWPRLTWLAGPGGGQRWASRSLLAWSWPRSSTGT